jgi:hypothetical protein
VATINSIGAQVVLGPLEPIAALARLTVLTFTPTGNQPPAFATAFSSLAVAINTTQGGWNSPGTFQQVLVFGGDDPSLAVLLATPQFARAQALLTSGGVIIHCFGRFATSIASVATPTDVSLS